MMAVIYVGSKDLKLRWIEDALTTAGIQRKRGKNKHGATISVEDSVMNDALRIVASVAGRKADDPMFSWVLPANLRYGDLVVLTGLPGQWEVIDMDDDFIYLGDVEGDTEHTLAMDDTQPVQLIEEVAPWAEPTQPAAKTTAAWPPAPIESFEWWQGYHGYYNGWSNPYQPGTYAHVDFDAGLQAAIAEN